MRERKHPLQTPDLSFERSLWTAGRLRVAGIDEAGRGALAGPVSAAAVILPAEPHLGGFLSGVRDSKQMTAIQRDTWAERVKEIAVAWGVGFSTHAEIDQYGIVPATILAMKRALGLLRVEPDHLLVDYLQIPACEVEQTGVTKGDAICLSIASASVLAKTARDACMLELADRYPAYGFATNKGYGTQAHRDALVALGPCPIHRQSFAPCAEFSIHSLSS